jgi:hypothetical protein
MEKMCQTLPPEYENLRAKCPCCGALMKLVIRSDGLQLELQSAPAAIQKDQPLTAHSNNSLMNIVSVSAADSRHKDEMSPGRIFSPDASNHHHNHHLNSVPLNNDNDSNDGPINDSNSSSQMSNSSISHNFMTVASQSPVLTSSVMSFRKQPESQQPHIMHRSNENQKMSQTPAVNHHYNNPLRNQVTPSLKTMSKCEISSKSFIIMCNSI